jgi:hypothetical protein
MEYRIRDGQSSPGPGTQFLFLAGTGTKIFFAGTGAGTKFFFSPGPGPKMTGPAHVYIEYFAF